MNRRRNETQSTNRCVVRSLWSGGHQRGQTTLDFAIGMSLFLSVLIFIFLFIPGLLSPFSAGIQEETVTTDRVADGLTMGMLGSPQQPYVLDEHCTQEFFAGNAPPSGCGYDSGGSTEERVGLDPALENVNVTIRGNATATAAADETLCWDGTNEELVAASGGCGTILTTGGNPPTNNDASVTALRVVSLNGQDVTVRVVMW
ncbi:DUF7287 family protein [Haloarcula rubripromontorii]|uniref:Uncharacterized protein n=1 Tax=Haloarcula rubripromontorii TaxID=1705562 RepID=A0A0N0U8U8_9EURY|nr:hypothetical protein AMS69_15700 [Haloarcula rubripromontorii]NLV06102.1 hypothetical protein [Haloarcula rubripromontorii]